MCSTDKKAPPSDSLEIVSKVKDPSLSGEIAIITAEIAKVSDDLKKAGTIKMFIEPNSLFNDDKKIRVRPYGGNFDEVNPIMDTIRDRLAESGISSIDSAFLRCPNSFFYLHDIYTPEVTR